MPFSTTSLIRSEEPIALSARSPFQVTPTSRLLPLFVIASDPPAETFTVPPEIVPPFIDRVDASVAFVPMASVPCSCNGTRIVIERTDAVVVDPMSTPCAPVRSTSFAEVGTVFEFQFAASAQLAVPAPPSHTTVCAVITSIGPIGDETLSSSNDASSIASPSSVTTNR